MEFLKLDLNSYWNLTLPIIILIVGGGIYGVISKSELINFGKYFAMFKCIFYLALAVLTFSLDVTEVNNKIIDIGFIIPEKLTLGQFLLIILSMLEAGSNLVDVFKVPKSEFHLLSKKEYWRYADENFLNQMKTVKRIQELENEIENIKRKNHPKDNYRKKKPRGRKRKN